jgi:hypothetical protein
LCVITAFFSHSRYFWKGCDGKFPTDWDVANALPTSLILDADAGTPPLGDRGLVFNTGTCAVVSFPDVSSPPLVMLLSLGLQSLLTVLDSFVELHLLLLRLIAS